MCSVAGSTSSARSLKPVIGVLTDAARSVFGGLGDIARRVRGLPGRVAGAIGDFRGARGVSRVDDLPSANPATSVGKVTPGDGPDFMVGDDGIVIPTDPSTLKQGRLVQPVDD